MTQGGGGWWDAGGGQGGVTVKEGARRKPGRVESGILWKKAQRTLTFFIFREDVPFLGILKASSCPSHSQPLNSLCTRILGLPREIILFLSQVPQRGL